MDLINLEHEVMSYRGSAFDDDVDTESLDSMDYRDEELVGSEAEEEEEEEEEVEEPQEIKNFGRYSSDFALPERDQCIVRVINVKNKKKVQIIKDNGFKYIIPVSKRLEGTINEKNYLLIQPTGEGSEELVEIVRVIDANYKRFYEANNIWPIAFDDPDLGVMGAPPKKKKKEKEKKKKKPKVPINAPGTPLPPPVIESTGKEPSKYKKKHTKKKMEKKKKQLARADSESEIEMNSALETDSDDSMKTKMEKRKMRLALIGTYVVKPGIDNTTVTPEVVTTREPIVKDRDLMPRSVGNPQPWAAIVDGKQLTEKQIKKQIAKNMTKEAHKNKMRLPRKLLTKEGDLPCGAVIGQYMTPWEIIAGPYPKKQKLDEKQ